MEWPQVKRSARMARQMRNLGIQIEMTQKAQVMIAAYLGYKLDFKNNI